MLVKCTCKYLVLQEVQYKPLSSFLQDKSARKEDAYYFWTPFINLLIPLLHPLPPQA